MKTTSLRWRSKAMLAAIGSSVLLSGIPVFADTLRNDIDASIDASLETMNLTEGGADGAVHFSVIATDGDGAAGCNLSVDAALAVNVSSSDPTVATVSPASLSFTNCTDVQTVHIHPVNGGAAEITLEQTANASAGSFNLSAATLAVVVAEVPSVDTTPPVITPTVSPAANAAGWNNTAVTVSWAVTDPESEILSKVGCNASTRMRETSGLMLVCAATSAGGSSRGSVTLKIDKTTPRIMVFSPADGAEFALNEEVNAHWSAADGRSGIASSTGTEASGDAIDTSVLGTHTFSVTAMDNAGNSFTKEVSYTVVAPDDDEDEDDDEEEDDDEDEDDDDEEDEHHGRGHVTICHKGRGSLSIGLPALKAHLKHGDTIGRCES